MRIIFLKIVNNGDEFRKLILPKHPQFVISLNIHPYKKVRVRHVRKIKETKDIFFNCIFKNNDSPRYISVIIIIGDKKPIFPNPYWFIVCENAVASNDLLMPDIMNTKPTMMLNMSVFLSFIYFILTKETD